MKRQYVDGTCFKVIRNNLSKDYLVLVHGLGLNLDVWTWQIPLLKSYNIILYDLRGHGESDPTELKPSLQDFANQLNDLLGHLNQKEVTLIGFSLGAMIARKFSILFPKKVKSLVLLNSPNKSSEKEKIEVESRANLVKNKGADATVGAALNRWFSDNFRKDNTQIMELTSHWIRSNDRNVYSKIYPLLYFGSIELSGNPCLTRALILTCDEDFANGPEVAHEISNDLPNSKVVILKKLRHMALVEDPKSVNDEITRFLDS